MRIAGRGRCTISSVGGEEISPTATCARARHRGQCSIASQWTLGLMLNPHRGQLKSGAVSRRAADRLGFITLPRFSRSRAHRIAVNGAAARNTTRRCAALPTQRSWAPPTGEAHDEVGWIHHASLRRGSAWRAEGGCEHPSYALVDLLCGGATLSSAPTSRPTVIAPPKRSISSSPGREGGHPPFRDRSAPITHQGPDSETHAETALHWGRVETHTQKSERARWRRAPSDVP